MKSRRVAREACLQLLYACDSLGDWSEENAALVLEVYFLAQRDEELRLSPECLEFAQSLRKSIVAHLEQIDQTISAASQHWSLRRMSRVDRNILRIAVNELLFMPDIPSKVSINEAIEIAKRFASDESPTFINGVLDRIANSLPEAKIAVND